MSDISVFVPSYNHATFVERTLRSIFGQTQQPKELIVIDDGSKDESVAVIRKALADCPFPSELIVRENRGLCAALNEGLDRTSGEFFAYLGSDDVWLPQFLEKRAKLLANRPDAVLAFGHAFLIDDDDWIIDRTDNWTTFADGDMLPLLLRGTVFTSPSVVYRRGPLLKIGWNVNSVLEDYELYLKLAAEGEFALDTSILCAWRQHGNNVSGNMPLMHEEWIAAQDRVSEQLNISGVQLRSIQAELRFRCVASLARHGFRREAAARFLENRHGATSMTELIDAMIRVFIPTAVHRLIREAKHARNRKRYGRLEISG